VAAHRKNPLESLEKEIGSRRAKLQLRITHWRAEQKLIMPNVANHILEADPCDVELENLFLPSCLDTHARLQAEVTDLGIEEGKLREGAVFDALHMTQTAVKTISTLQGNKAKNSRGQAQNTRSVKTIGDVEACRNLHIDSYNAHRMAMISLGIINADDPKSPFPPLQLKDTFMKSTTQRRQLGDSRRTDGILWSFPTTNNIPPSNGVPPITSKELVATGINDTAEPLLGLSLKCYCFSMFSD
jgi:hypothetical protein